MKEREKERKETKEGCLDRMLGRITGTTLSYLQSPLQSHLLDTFGSIWFPLEFEIPYSSSSLGKEWHNKLNGPKKWKTENVITSVMSFSPIGSMGWDA